MKTLWTRFGMLLVCATLVACRADLYSGLPESEANQMIALLRSHGIDAEKVGEKGGTAGLKVERDAFVKAVELLRQNGLPRRKSMSMNDVFPGGQLVTSPAQERAKMTFLKEQQLESMLASMDGVIVAGVSIAQPTDDAGNRAGASSVAVLIKYSPSVNLANSEADIRRLVLDSVPDAVQERISVVLQPATFSYIEPSRPVRRLFLVWIRENMALAGMVAGALSICIAIAGVIGVAAVRRGGRT